MKTGRYTKHILPVAPTYSVAILGPDGEIHSYLSFRGRTEWSKGHARKLLTDYRKTNPTARLKLEMF